VGGAGCGSAAAAGRKRGRRSESERGRRRAWRMKKGRVGGLVRKVASERTFHSLAAAAPGKAAR